MADERTDPQYKVRMPAELHARLKAEAEANKRSMNAEIVARLERSLGEAISADDGDKHRLLNPAGLEAMRFLATETERNLTEMKDMIAEAKAVAFRLIEEREAAEARKGTGNP